MASAYAATLATALRHRKTLVLAAMTALLYMPVLAYSSELAYRVSGPQFPGVASFPHIAVNPWPTLLLPHLAFQPTPGWYLEINVVQAAALALIAALVVVNVALSSQIMRLRGPGRSPSWLAGTAPFLASNGTCVACAGLPAALAFIPASLSALLGGMLTVAQFYGIPMLLAIVVLGFLAVFNLDRAAAIPWEPARLAGDRPGGAEQRSGRIGPAQRAS